MPRHAVVLTVLAILMVLAPAARADGKVELFGVRMDPSDVDARRFADPGWGAGLELVAPFPGTATLFAGVIGIDAVNLLSKTIKFQDPTTGFRVEQQTSQNYGRLYLGTQVGPHGGGTLRPYAGVDVAAVWYGIGTDVVVPDDTNRENEIRQSLRSRSEVAFGWDASAGVDINFRDRWCIDVGVRSLHAYGVPQSLGADAVTVQPAYIQYRVGFGVGLGQLTRSTH